MKIAILADPLDNQSAGVHVYTIGMVDSLLQYHEQHDYVLIREKRDPQLPSSVKQIVIPNFRFIPLYASFRLFVFVPLILRRLKVDAVVEPAHFGPFNLPARTSRITVIHDLTPLLFPEHHRWHSQVLQRLFLKRILKKTHLILTVSRNTEKDLHRIFPFTKMKTLVIFPGRDPFFQPDTSTAALERLQITVPYFLSVGTIEPRKNLVFLLQAYQVFRETHDYKIDLVITGGKGWKSQAFFEELKTHPFKEDIHLIGFVDKQDLPQLYTHSIALVYPSLYEGFGLPVLEAMACGTTVICSDRSSLPEVGGEAAFYFDQEDIESLVQQFRIITKDKSLLEKQRKESLKQASTFSWKNYADSFVEALRSLRSPD